MNKKTVEFFINNILMFYGLFDDEYGDEFIATVSVQREFSLCTHFFLSKLVYLRALFVNNTNKK